MYENTLGEEEVSSLKEPTDYLLCISKISITAKNKKSKFTHDSEV